MKKKRKEKYYIIAAIIIILLGILLFMNIKHPKPLAMEWKNLGNGQWRAVNLTCLGGGLNYTCTTNCFDMSKQDIWNLCKSEGNMLKTNTGKDVLCFSSSCSPRIVNGSCRLMCPI